MIIEKDHESLARVIKDVSNNLDKLAKGVKEEKISIKNTIGAFEIEIASANDYINQIKKEFEYAERREALEKYIKIIAEEE